MVTTANILSFDKIKKVSFFLLSSSFSFFWFREKDKEERIKLCHTSLLSNFILQKRMRKGNPKGPTSEDEGDGAIPLSMWREPWELAKEELPPLPPLITWLFREKIFKAKLFISAVNRTWAFLSNKNPRLMRRTLGRTILHGLWIGARRWYSGFFWHGEHAEACILEKSNVSLWKLPLLACALAVVMKIIWAINFELPRCNRDRNRRRPRLLWRSNYWTDSVLSRWKVTKLSNSASSIRLERWYKFHSIFSGICWRGKRLAGFGLVVSRLWDIGVFLLLSFNL